MKKNEICLAGGCFWGIQHDIKKLAGVEDAVVGYANSIVNKPSYEMVCSGKTEAVEAVWVFYNPEILPLNDLLDAFMDMFDPTSINQQGPDIGSQYRSGIYHTDDKFLAEIKKYIMDNHQQNYSDPIQIEFAKLQNFAKAEEYHQDYFAKNFRR